MLYLWFRKYISIIILAIIISIVTILIFSASDFFILLESFFTKKVFITIITNCLLIRVMDDFYDYHEDLKAGKALFSQVTLFIFIGILIGLSILCSWSNYLWLDLIIIFMIISIMSNFYQNKYQFAFCKIIFIPLNLLYLILCLEIDNNWQTICYYIVWLLCALLYQLKGKKR